MFVSEEVRKNGFRSIVQIKGDVRSVLGEEVFYRLYEVRRAGMKSYAINVACGVDNEIFSFGTNRIAAVEIYRKIVEYTVTPCTLKDIADDFSTASGGKKRTGTNS